MQEIRRYEMDIDYCPSCKGIWLDRSEIDKIATAQNRFEITMIMTMTIIITVGTEDEEVSLATCLILIR
jgi:Zn-finger nucleic acid-binding protein